MIPQQTVNEILDATQIVDVIGDFVTLKRRGANWTACCPFHSEKTPSFYVSPSKGIYKCFGCGKAGSAVSFLMEHEAMTYPEALRWLAAKYHITVEEEEQTAEQIEAKHRTESLYIVSDFAEKFFQQALTGTKEGHDLGLAYFHSRGLEDATIAKFGLGWAPSGRHALLDAATKAGYRQEYLIDTGLCVKYEDSGAVLDKFFNRVTFPIHSVSGRVIAFGARTLEGGHPTAKYLNSPTTEIYEKDRSLYGVYFAKNEISRQDKCILVEGYLDVLSMHQLGICNVLASSGTSLTTEQCRLIHRFTDNVTIMYDGDSAGIHAALRGIGLVLREGLNVKVVLLPDGEDPDSYARSHTLAEVQAYIADNERDFIEFKSDWLLRDAGDDPLRKANLINDIADTIAGIPDPVKRSVYVSSCAVKFGIGEDVIFQRVRETLRTNQEADRREGVERRHRDYQEAQRRQAAGLPPVRNGGYKVQPEPLAGYVENSITAPAEKDLLSFLLKYGDAKLAFETDSRFWTQERETVAEFIDSAVRDMPFANGPFRKVFDEYMEAYYDGGEQEAICMRLLNNEDDAVRTISTELTVEKYRLTVKAFEDSLTATDSWLVKYVPHAILVYDAKCLEDRMARLGERMKAEDVPPEEMRRLVDELQEARATLNNINNELGRDKIR